MSKSIEEIEKTIQVGIEKLGSKTRMPTTVAELEDIPYTEYQQLLNDMTKGAISVCKHKVSMILLSGMIMTDFEKVCFLTIVLWTWILPIAGLLLAIFKSWEYVFAAILVFPAMIASKKYYMNKLVSVIKQSELAFVFFYRLGAVSLKLADGTQVHYKNNNSASPA